MIVSYSKKDKNLRSDRNNFASHGKISPAAGFMIICCCPAGFSERISEPGLDLEQRFSCSLFSDSLFFIKTFLI